MSSSSLQTGLDETESNRYRHENSAAINKNVDLAVKQAICWAIMAGISENVFSVFANHLNAPHYFYAALAWIPAFIGPFIQIYSANVLDTYQHRLKLVYRPIFIQAFSFIPLILIALFCQQIENQNSEKVMTIPLFIFILFMLVYTMSGHFSAPPWQSLIGDFVSAKERGSFFAKLSRSVSFFSLAGQTLVGIIFYIISHFYENSFQVLSFVYAGCFLVSFIARFSGAMLIKKMDETPYQPPASSVFTFWQFIKRAKDSNFVKFVVFSAVLHCGANIAGPFFLPYWTDTLHLSTYGWLSLQAAGVVSSILTLMIWGRFSDIFGNKRTMKYCAILISLTPFCWIFVHNFWLLMLLQMFSMVFWTGYNLSSINYIYEAASQPKRARCFAYYSLIIGTGVLLGTQIGLLVAKYSPKDFFGYHIVDTFYWVLVASGLFRLLSCVVFLKNFKELRDVKPFELNSFWSDVLHIRSVVGIPLIRKDEDPNHKNYKN